MLKWMSRVFSNSYYFGIIFVFNVNWAGWLEPRLAEAQAQAHLK